MKNTHCSSHGFESFQNSCNPCSYILVQSNRPQFRTSVEQSPRASSFEEPVWTVSPADIAPGLISSSYKSGSIRYSSLQELLGWPGCYTSVCCTWHSWQVWLPGRRTCRASSIQSPTATAGGISPAVRASSWAPSCCAYWQPHDQNNWSTSCPTSDLQTDHPGNLQLNIIIVSRITFMVRIIHSTPFHKKKKYLKKKKKKISYLNSLLQNMTNKIDKWLIQSISAWKSLEKGWFYIGL